MDEATLPGYRTASSVHKVQVGAEQAARIAQRGGKVLADYGSYQLLEVDAATLAAVATTPSLELRDEYNVIRLNAGPLDTASAHGASQRGMTLPASGKRFHLVQFSGPIQSEWYAGLEATGVQIVTYIPNNAYLVYGDAPAFTRLQAFTGASKAVQWDGAYLDDYKLDPTVNTVETGAYSIQLIKDEAANPTTLAAINRVKTRSGVVQEALGYVDVVAFMSRRDAIQLALQPDVVSIQPYVEPKLRDERQDMIISGNLTGNNPTGPGYMAWLTSKGFTQAQFTASGFGVDLTDSGIDNATTSPNHFGLYVNGDVLGTSRIVYNRLEGTPNAGSTLQGCDGHGTLNSHIIGGYASQTAAPFADATGYRYGLGVAPFVKIGSSVIFDPGTFTSPNYENLQSKAYNDGMRISSNSWGSSANTYTTDAQRYDALVRDAQPTGSTFATAGNQEMVIVFAAGNGGSGANTVGSPSTGKNVITVGASENVHPFGAADQCAVADTDANSLNDIAFFSSRGPTSDGRKKPDIVAPGTHVSGGVAQTAGQHANPPAAPLGSANACFDATGVCAGPGTSNFWPLAQQWYTASSGTSHSTPATAGGAALLRQYFINQGLPPPSPAMTKAYLTNAARYMNGSGANDNLYSNNQGMGLLDLGKAFDGVPRMLRDEVGADLFTASGQTRVFTGFVSDSSKPFRVTLAWTDAPGATTGSAWKNNLDLTVALGANTYRGNVFTGANSVTGGAADLSNNMESVFLPAGQTGAFTVTVTATNINSDGVPGNASVLDQDFALVMANACATQPAAPTGLTATAGGPNRIDLAWSLNGSTNFNVYRSTTTGGPYTLVGTATSGAYSDSTVSGGTTYFYVVRAVACAESVNSNEASALAVGACTLPPTFAGLAAATNGAAATCANNLSWAAATPRCGGTITYSVYRGTATGFTPSAANRIATGVSGTSFADNLNLTNGTAYFYVVHAVETGAATTEDSNTVERSATPTGVITPAINYFDDMDANRPPNAAAYWIPTTITGTLTLNMVSGCHYQSATTAWRYGANTTTCGGTYAVSQSNLLKLGGNGSVAGINGFVIPAGATGTMTFNLWYDLESTFDGAQLVYNTTGINGTYVTVTDVVSATAPYISAGGYDNSVTGLGGRSWTGTNTGANGALKAVTVNLNALAGTTVWFGFKTYSDSIITREGIYIDDVRINVNSVGTCTTNVPPPGPAVTYRLSGLPASVGAGTATSFTVTALDAVGQTASGYTGTAAFTSTDAQATLPPNTAFVAGVAAGVPVTFKTLGPQSITATDTTTATLTGTGSTTVTPGAAAALQVQVQPSTAVAGTAIAPAVQVKVVDQFGNLVNTSTASITVALGNNPGGGTLSGTTTVAAAGGVATFSTLSIDKVGTGYTLVASAAGLTNATSSAFNITPAAPASLAVTVQPSSAVAGVAISPAVRVALLDAFGNVTTSSANVTLAIATNPSGGVLSGATTVAASAGVATFSTLSIDKVGTGYTLVANSGALASVTTNAFNITPNAPYSLALTTQPSNAVAGVAIAPAIQVTVMDRFGNVAPSPNIPVTMSLGNNPYGGTLSGTRTVTSAAGVASFSTLSVDKAGTAYTLVAGSSGVLGTTSVGFDISAAAPARLAFTVQPSSAVAGAAIAPAVAVAVQDAFGNTVSASVTPITVSLGSNPSGGTLSGTTTVAPVGGVATFSTLSVDRAGAGYTLAANAPGLTRATSGAFNVVAGAPAQLVFAVQPGAVAAGASMSPAVQVAVTDAFGNLVTSSSASITLGLASNPSGGTLSGTTTVSAASGVASFPNLSIDKAGTGYTLAAASTGLTGATSAAFDVVPGSPARLVFSAQPSNAAAGAFLSPAVAVTVQDSFGNTVTSSTANVTLALGNNPSGGTLGGTTTAAAVGGVALFSNLSVDKVGTGYTLAASSGGLSGATSAAFNVTPAAAAHLAFTVQPSASTAGASISPAVVVVVQDAFGNTVTSATHSISLALAGPAGGTLSGAAPVSAVGGVATFAGLSVDRAASGYTLVASAAGLAGATSAAFDVSAGAPAALVFQVEPSSTVAGASISPAVAVAIQDSLGNTVTSSTASVTVALGNNPSGGTLSGTATAAAVNGVASFSNLAIDKAGTGYTLAASAGGLTSATSAAFDVAVGSPASLTFVVQPGNAVAGANLSPAVQVVVQDSQGNTVTSAVGSVDVALSGPAGGTLSGTTSVQVVNGVASFADLSIARAGAGYTLVASAPGVTSATSAPFAITAGPAAALAFSVQPGMAQAGAALSPAVLVTVLDALGNTVTTSTASVALALGTNPASGTLSGTVTANAVNGVATFANLSLDRAAAGYTLVASATGLSSATSAAFDITVGPPSRLAFTTQPANTRAGATLAAVVVTLQDPLGNTVPANTDVTLVIGVNPSGGLLGGTRTVAAVNGVATFTDLAFTRAGNGYTLVASAQGYAGATSAAFNIGAGQPAAYVLSGLPGSVTAGQEVAFSVSVQDAYGNAITDYAGTAAVTSSDSNAVLPGAQTFVNGVLDGVKVTFKTGGLQSVTVTDRNTASLKATGKVNVTSFPPPTVSVTSPHDQDALTGKVTITAHGAVAPGTTLSQISILVDGVVVGTSHDLEASVEWNTNTAPNPSQHSITAVISDAAGNVAVSVPVTVTVRRGCGCGATGGVDASSVLALVAAGRALLAWRKRRRQAQAR